MKINTFMVVEYWPLSPSQVRFQYEVKNLQAILNRPLKSAGPNSSLLDETIDWVSYALGCTCLRSFVS